MTRFAAILVLALGLEVRGATQLSVGNVNAAPGASVAVPISLQSDVAVAALQAEVLVSPALLGFSEPAVISGPASHVADGEWLSPALLRVVSYSLFNTPIPNGTVLSANVTLPSSFTSGTVTLTLTNVIVSSPAGIAIAGVQLQAGSIRASTGGGNVQIRAVTAANNRIQFEITGLTGGSLVVESSSDLRTWSTVETQPVTGAAATFSRAIPGGQARQFYRVRIP
jgi:hypothetical protein